MDVWLQTQTLLGRLTGRGPWYRTTPVQDATNMRHWNCTNILSQAVLRLLSCRPLALFLMFVSELSQEAVLLRLHPSVHQLINQSVIQSVHQRAGHPINHLRENS